ncbi:hypothetical protein IMG5_114150 [Ichthyophthirius multifiliis]|uniref:GB1/RHD3-type G domain-containing protein n=1 Tax=Ichthyophthirius multifiliis TaxID=5932 RepID=G0QU19_ICHMU|nr:hypothetical protein IMG5_114150 [Ichthyophthirius multifiliis]EGR31286.1 hypothetical protein IMG5_114150 [Ichthyophthirius multifiliis]|eukprot:XP_004034772.1 hypothetical protein IMG5_114150 [Ichthyophthirius multifiliis]
MHKEKSDQAIPFIIYQQNYGFKLNPEAEEYLKQLNPNKKLAVVSIVGKYRTGKSFFVNRVLLERHGQKSGFSVGPTINPCTKGLWIWKECLKSPDSNEDTDIILIDTEGFGGMDENTNHDSRIFLFSLLLSSYFIYNSQGNIDENALNNISLIINLAKDIKPGVNDGDSADYFPSFMWVLRDFALQMKDLQGQKISAKDYLEKALEQQKGISDNIEQKNKIRRQLKHFFKDRDCYTLIRPVESEAELQKLNEMQNEDLRPEFVEQIGQLRQRIFKKIKPKMLNGKHLNGFQLVEICKAYIQAINKGGVPNIESAWNYMCKSESIKAKDICLNEVQQQLDSLFRNQDQIMGYSQEQINKLQNKMKEEVFKKFKQKSIAGQDEIQEYFDMLECEFQEKFKGFKNNVKEKQEQKMNEICNKLISELETKLHNEQFENFYQFQNEYNQFKQNFEKNFGKEHQEYLTKISENIYKLAAEKVALKQQRNFEKEKKVFESMKEINEGENKKKENLWNEEKKRLEAKIYELEKEKSQFQANENYLKEKVQRLQNERDKYEKNYEQLSLKMIENQQKSINEDEFNNLLRKLEESKLEYQNNLSKSEKQNALFQQENKFLQKENENLQNQIEKINFQQQNEQKINFQQQQNMIILQNQIQNLENEKKIEIENIKNQLQMKIKELSNNQKQNIDIQKMQSEFIVEKQYLENQINFLQNQLDENKRLHDALLLALQQGLNKDEGENTNELVETNKNLSAAMDKLEQRLYIGNLLINLKYQNIQIIQEVKV